MTTLHVSAKSVYGQIKYYPISHEAQVLAKMTGTKTLTRWHFEAAKQLGWAIKITDGAELDSWLEQLMGEVQS